MSGGRLYTLDPPRQPMPAAPWARGPPQRCAAPPGPARAGPGPGPGPGWQDPAGPQGGRRDAGLAEEPRALPAAAAGRRYDAAQASEHPRSAGQGGRTQRQANQEHTGRGLLVRVFACGEGQAAASKEREG